MPPRPFGQLTLVWQQEQAVRDRKTQAKELEAWMRQQRQRINAQLAACTKRIASRRDRLSDTGDYVIEHRKAVGTDVRVSQEMPFALSPYAQRTRNL